MNTLLKYNLINALLLSIFFHVIVLNTFVFQFSITPEPFKPNITFLGSILNRNEMLSAANPNEQNKTEESSLDKSLLNDHLYGRLTITSTAVEKPGGKGISSDTTKLFIKNSFLNNDNNASQSPQIDALDIDNNMPSSDPYKPLRIEEP